MQIFYRFRQFWNAITSSPSSDDLVQVQQKLSPKAFDLFLRMHPSEQSHSIHIYKQILEGGESNDDLITAALLHDIGKILHPLHILERIVIVLGKKIFPIYIDIWGDGDINSWRRPFVIAKKHPLWGAEMAEEADVSALAVDLIRHHQDSQPTRTSENPKTLEEKLLIRLQTLDSSY